MSKERKKSQLSVPTIPLTKSFRGGRPRGNGTAASRKSAIIPTIQFGFSWTRPALWTWLEKRQRREREMGCVGRGTCWISSSWAVWFWLCPHVTRDMSTIARFMLKRTKTSLLRDHTFPQGPNFQATALRVAQVRVVFTTAPVSGPPEHSTYVDSLSSGSPVSGGPWVKH